MLNLNYRLKFRLVELNYHLLSDDSVQSGKSKEPGICKLDLRLQAGYGIHPIDLSVGMFELWSSDMLKSAKDIEVVNDSKPCPSETVLVNPNYSSFIWAPSLWAKDGAAQNVQQIHFQALLATMQEKTYLHAWTSSQCIFWIFNL